MILQICVLHNCICTVWAGAMDIYTGYMSSVQCTCQSEDDSSQYIYIYTAIMGYLTFMLPCKYFSVNVFKMHPLAHRNPLCLYTCAD